MNKQELIKVVYDVAGIVKSTADYYNDPKGLILNTKLQDYINKTIESQEKYWEKVYEQGISSTT